MNQPPTVKVPALSDYTWAAIAGFMTGICGIPTAYHIGVHNIGILSVLPVIVAICWVVGVAVGRFLSRYLAVMYQISKFVAVGFLNTSIDFGVLNIISIVTGITAGFIVGGVNVPGFLLAALNSYCWNKLWVFRKIDENGFFHDLPKFIAVATSGVVIDSLIVIAFTTYLDPLFGLSRVLWLNIGKLCATIFVLIWDFTGYKYIAFRITNKLGKPS